MNRSTETIARPRVIIADDNVMILEKVGMLLEPDFEVVAAVSDGVALLEAVLAFKPQIGVIDISMPRMGGIEAVRQLKSEGSEMLVIFLTVHEDPDFVRAAFDSGASAYLIKSRMVTELLRAVRSALKGEAFISPCFPLNETELPVNSAD